MRASSLASLTIAALAIAAPARAALEDAGCTDCLGQRGPAGAPLVVALHGDNAPAYHKQFARSLAPAALRANVSLFAPRCPRDLGCTTASFWQWEMTRTHDPDWLGARVDEAIARYAADPKRVVAVGYSGGATYLGYYAPSHPDRFAAIAHVSGGSLFGVPACPSIKYPVLFFLGATDPMMPYTGPLRAYYDDCGGHEVVWKTERGVSHVGMLDRLANGGADEVIAWLVSHATVPAPPTAPVAGPTTTATATGEAHRTANDAPAPSATATTVVAPPATEPTPRAGCTCAIGERETPGAPIAAALALVAFLARLSRRARQRA